ncbi:hypothetical protein EWF20_04780 [Sulfolobus sp. S-194]|uniref:hypothetical protein n=1 Tax=Sulfolobus sp. S-194 TaxID=2512240 RepID=UPI001436F4D0|nr:hypothetical protein [Sulfolobus sp. S-194]QIW23536.1 hypothetical protein EWF20_04780 [Sulfolobus sp. S-194]
MSEIYFEKKENRVVIFAGNYYAIFEGNNVKGKIEIQGLKVEFEGKIDKLPETKEEANEIIKSLFYQTPKKVSYGAVVEAENDKVRIKAWGITINDINALFNRLSEMKPLPIDVTKLSLQYDMPLHKVKKIVKDNPLKLQEEAYKFAISNFGNRLPRIEEKDNFKVILDVVEDGGILILVYKGEQIYKAKISFATLYKYLEMNSKELIEEAFNLLEGLINLQGKVRSDSNILPGIVEGQKKNGKFVIKSENEEAEIPGESYDEVKRFLSSLRREVYLS